MKERPIIFNTEMVKAILDGRKLSLEDLLKGILLTLLNPLENYRMILNMDMDFMMVKTISNAHSVKSGISFMLGRHSPKLIPFHFKKKEKVKDLCRVVFPALPP